MTLRGDLADASPAELLAGFADQRASGCLWIERATRTPGSDPVRETGATLHLRNGAVYAAALTGSTFLLGTRLVTSYALTDEALSEALEAQRNELAGWRLAEILVHLGHVQADIVERVSTEQVLEVASEVFSWRNGSWKFRSGERTHPMLAHPLEAAGLFSAVQARHSEWQELVSTIGGRHALLVRTQASMPLSTSRELVALLRAAEELSADSELEACSHAAGLSLLEGARLAVSGRAAGLLVTLPDLARPAVPPITRTSYALARLLELDGPGPLTMPVTEEFYADLAPEPVLDSGHHATVLDLDAARAARGAESAAIEAAAEVRDAEVAVDRAWIAQPELADAPPVKPMTAGERLGMFSATRDPMADTAALMRELTSLGDVDDDMSENRTSTRSSPAQDPRAAPDKKRKGLFGR